MKKATKKKTYIGTNIRLTDAAYKQIKDFCDEHGYKIGAFVEIAALKQLKRGEYDDTNH